MEGTFDFDCFSAIHTEKLMRTSLTILNDTTCAKLSEAAAGRNLFIEDLQICTFDKGTDTCVASTLRLILAFGPPQHLRALSSGGENPTSTFQALFPAILFWASKIPLRRPEFYGNSYRLHNTYRFRLFLV